MPKRQKKPAPATAAGGAHAASTEVTGRAVLRSMAVIVAIDVTLLFVWRQHIHVWISVFVSVLTGGLILAGLGLKWLPDPLIAGAKESVARFIGARGTFRALLGLLAMLIFAAPFIGSIHVTANTLDGPVTLYRLASGSGTGSVIVQDSAVLDTVKAHTDFLFWTRRGQSRWVRTSTFQRTRDLRSNLSTAHELLYPIHFDPMVMVSVLPMPLVLAIRRDENRHLVIRTDSGAHDILVDTIFNTVSALQISLAQPPSPDSSTRTRWIRLTSAALQVDTADVVDVVTEWIRNSRWVRASRSLTSGERLRAVVTDQRGDTVAVDTFTIVKPIHDALLRRR